MHPHRKDEMWGTMQLLAVALVCAVSTPVQECSRATALDVVVARVVTPIECAMRGQTLIAASFGTEVGQNNYLKVICERQRNVASADR